MKIWDMVCELKEAVDDGDIENDYCPHATPSDTNEFCRVCFILNCYEHISPDNPEDEELSEKQIKAIYFLHAKHIDGEEGDWEDFDEL